MLDKIFSENIRISCDNHSKGINIICEQNAVFLITSAICTYNNH